MFTDSGGQSASQEVRPHENIKDQFVLLELSEEDYRLRQTVKRNVYKHHHACTGGWHQTKIPTEGKPVVSCQQS